MVKAAVALGLLYALRPRPQASSIGAVFKELPNEMWPCGDGTYSDHNRRGACNWHGGLKGKDAILLRDCSDSSGAVNVVDVPLGDVQIFTEKFQNRESPYSIESVQRIVDAAVGGDFRFEEFDPILLWENESGKLYVLSGHSRFEAFKRLCEMDMQQFCRIPAKIIRVSQEEAEEIALRSNTLSTKETDTERAAFYRKEMEAGATDSDVRELARKNEGRNANMILAFAALNPYGKAMTALKALEQSADMRSAQNARAIAQWIGDARLRFPELSNLHEDEMYEWLMAGAYGGQYTSKSEFLKKIEAVIYQRTEFGVFDENKPLNLFNTAHKSFSEKQYDQMEEEIKDKIRQQQKLIEQKQKDYLERGASQKQLPELMERDYQLLSRYRIDLAALQQKKAGILAQAKNELNLFAVSGLWAL